MLQKIGNSNFEILSKFFLNYNSEFYKKKEKIEELMKLENDAKKIFGEFKEINVENLLDEDEDFKKILQEEKNLLEKKINLEEKLHKKFEEIQSFKNESKKNYEENQILLNKKLEDLTNLEMNLNLLISEIQPGIVSKSIIRTSTQCGNCGNNKPEIKKIICEECKTFYCENNCISYCISDACKNKKTIICNSHSKKCGLCDKANFCEFCLKSCYYINCDNKFCVNCYRRNQHQTRNPEFNCKFFTCEKDQVNDCIMCSLFCQKCEQRLCKGCVKGDIEHFSFLKN